MRRKIETYRMAKILLLNGRGVAMAGPFEVLVDRVLKGENERCLRPGRNRRGANYRPDKKNESVVKRVADNRVLRKETNHQTK